MDVQVMTSMIGSVGFPIVMCILLFNYIKEEQSNTRKILTDLQNTFNVFIAKMDDINDLYVLEMRSRENDSRGSKSKTNKVSE